MHTTSWPRLQPFVEAHRRLLERCFLRYVLSSKSTPKRGTPRLEPKRSQPAGVPDDASARRTAASMAARRQQTGHGREDDCPPSPVRSTIPPSAGREDLGEARPSIAVMQEPRFESSAPRGLDLFHHQVVVQVRGQELRLTPRADDDQGAVAIDHEDGIGEDAPASRDDETVASFPSGRLTRSQGDEAHSATQYGPARHDQGRKLRGSHGRTARRRRPSRALGSKEDMRWTLPIISSR